MKTWSNSTLYGISPYNVSHLVNWVLKKFTFKKYSNLLKMTMD